MGTSIQYHEPSRHLFMGIADAAWDLANEPAGEGFMEKLFALDRQFHPGGVQFVFMIPREDKIRVDLNGPYIYDAKFFLPKGLHQHERVIRTVYFHLIKACASVLDRRGISLEDRYDVGRYAGLSLDISPQHRALILAAVEAIRAYFLKTHVAGQLPQPS